VQVIVRGVIVATVYFTASEILPAVVSNDPVRQAVFDKTVEDAVDGHPVHLLLQFCGDTIMAQGVWFFL
jgi:hypothetical protein